MLAAASIPLSCAAADAPPAPNPLGFASAPELPASPAAEVPPAGEAVGAPASPAGASSSFVPRSALPIPQSGTGDDAPAGRRQAPLCFIASPDRESDILAAIARGDRTLPDLAHDHHTTVPALCIWLQREDIQHKLTDLASAGATLTRIAAANHLPKAVRAMAFQIDSYIFDRTHNLIKPGLEADRAAAARDAHIRKAAHLLLRLARFDPAQPLYRKREPAASSAFPIPASFNLPEGGGAEQREAVGAPASPTKPPSSSATSPLVHSATSPLVHSAASPRSLNPKSVIQNPKSDPLPAAVLAAAYHRLSRHLRAPSAPRLAAAGSTGPAP